MGVMSLYLLRLLLLECAPFCSKKQLHLPHGQCSDNRHARAHERPGFAGRVCISGVSGLAGYGKGHGGESMAATSLSSRLRSYVNRSGSMTAIKYFPANEPVCV